VVAKDSGIHSYSDLKGKRVCGNFPTPSLQLQTEAYLSNGNVSWKDITPVPVGSVVEGIKMVMEGRADSSGTITLGTPVIEELNAKKGARFLPMDPSPEVIARMRKFHPGYMIKVKPGPGNTGIEKEQYLWAYDIYLIIYDKVSNEPAYLITKVLWENYTEFEKVHKLLKDWNPSRFVSKNAVIPYHPGAIKFYKEKGVWDEEMDRLQKSLIEKKK
jgi:TRAP transporter TAXI family solute receptor